MSTDYDPLELAREHIDDLTAEVKRLQDLLPKAFDAGCAYAIGSHRDFKQIHPTRDEWVKQALEASGD